MGTGSFSGLKLPGRGDDHQPPSSAKVKERVELYLYSLSWAFVACFRVNFTFTFTFSFTGNASDFYSGGNKFEYRPRYGLF
jgi:hypothetical protein